MSFRFGRSIAFTCAALIASSSVADATTDVLPSAELRQIQDAAESGAFLIAAGSVAIGAAVVISIAGASPGIALALGAAGAVHAIGGLLQVGRSFYLAKRAARNIDGARAGAAGSNAARNEATVSSSDLDPIPAGARATAPGSEGAGVNR